MLVALVWRHGHKGELPSELEVALTWWRARFRNSFTNLVPIPANRVVEYTIDLHTNNHAFLEGHRIMVQVQSTWFPLYDRNPQKFVDNIFLARDSDYKAATQRVFRSSRLGLGVRV